MRVLLTGSSGLVGRACSAGLAARGWDVVGLARGDGADEALSEFVTADIGSTDAAETVAAATAPCNAIVHAASAIDSDDASPAISMTNCLGTQQVLSLGQRWDVRRFVYISSIGVIGRPAELPVTESHRVSPRTAYHASKLFGEQLVDCAASAGLSASSLRLTAPIGAGMPAGRIVPSFVRAALAGEPLTVAGQGSRRQNYVDVRDVAQAVERSLDTQVDGVFNVAGSAAISNRELAELCVRLLGSNSHIEQSGAGDPEEGVAWDVSIEKARSELGYEPAITLDESLSELAGSTDS